MAARGIPQRILVVGNGIAGLTTCDTLRTEGYTGEIIVVGAEPHAAYSRPALSKALLALDSGLAAHELPESSHGATELRGVSARGVDPQARTVTLSDGSRLGYDGLVIASGARARRFTDSPSELTLRELDDAAALRAALASSPRVAILGGGVLGMEIASGALAAGCAVTLVARAAPMSKQLGAHLAGLVGTAASAWELEIVVAHDAAVIAHGDEVRIVADGNEIAADVVVSAVGEIPNVEWLADSGLLRDGVLLADRRGRVAADIVAAGDVATWRGANGPWRLPLWTSAIEQAKVAARALLHGDEAAPIAFQPYFWTEQFGLGLKAVGELPVHGEPEVLEHDAQTHAALLRWTRPDGSRTAVSVNYRIPIPRLRRLTEAAA